MSFRRSPRLLAPLISAFLLAAGACLWRAGPPSSPWTDLAAYDTGGWTHDIHLTPDQVHLSDREGGLLTFPRGLPLGVGTRFAPVRDVVSLAPHEQGTFVAARFEGLVAVGSDGGVMGRLRRDGDIANAVALRDGLAYVAFGRHGLVVARLTPHGIELTGSLPTAGWSHDVKLQDGCAFVADWRYGLRIVDVRTPERPVELAVVPTPATAIAVALSPSAGVRRLAAVAEGHAGVALVDVTEPAHPRPLGRADLGLRAGDPPHPRDGGWAHGVAWHGDLVFVANWKRGIAVIDASNPRRPSVAAELPTAGTALAVAVEPADDGALRVWIADGEAGLRVVSFRGARRTARD